MSRKERTATYIKTTELLSTLNHEANSVTWRRSWRCWNDKGVGRIDDKAEAMLKSKDKQVGRRNVRGWG
jgi:hypothetical protein